MLAAAGGALVQSVTGFGFSLVAAPAVAALSGPAAAVSAVSVLGACVNVLTLASERRPLSGDRVLARTLILWSLPGMVAGALVLRIADESLLKVLVALAVLFAALVRLLPLGAAFALPARPAGVLSGAFGTASGLSGPPLLLHLLGSDEPPVRTRDTLAAVFLAQGVVGVVILLATGAWETPHDLAACVAAVVVGHVAGRRVFHRLPRAAYERLVLLTLVVAGALSVVLVAG